jgi:hypothetical protein
MGEASELIPPDKEACSSDSVFGDPQTLEKASPPQSSVLLPTPKVLLPTPKPKVPGSAQPKSPIGPPPKKGGLTGFTGARLQILKAGNTHQFNSADIYSDHSAMCHFHNIAIYACKLVSLRNLDRNLNQPTVA